MSLNIRTLLIPVLFMAILLFSAGCTQGTAPTMGPAPVVTTTETATPAVTAAASAAATKEEMVAFVKEAVAYAKANGKEKALAEFSNPKGSFFRGELYIYAYDINGTTIAHPVNPEKIGVNRINEKDVKGNLFIQDLREAALNGTGFATYYYINPTQHNQIEKKLGYAMMVDDTWWLGSGIYYGPDDTMVAPVPETSPASATTGQPV